MSPGTAHRLLAIVAATFVLSWAGHDRAGGDEIAAAPEAPRRAAVNPFAQVKAPKAADDDKAEDEVGGVFLPTDRAVKRRLDAAKTLIEKEEFSEGVRILGGILEGEEDSFFRTEGRDTSFRSLKSESRRLLGELPSAGRDAYQLQFGVEARDVLDKAVTTGDSAKLAEVSRRFFHTDAGYEATFLLGNYHLDHSRPLAAALTFGQLLNVSHAARQFEPNLSVLAATSWLRAGLDDKARGVLAELHREHPDAALEVAGKQQKIFTAAKNKPDQQPETAALNWLKQLVGKQLGRAAAGGDQWVMFRGDETRNGESRGGLPMLAPPRWRVRFIIDPGIERLVQKMRDAYQRSDVAAPPGLHALAVPDVPDPKTGVKRDFVLMRDVKHLMAVDFQTGKRIWVVESERSKDDGFDKLVKSSRNSAPNPSQPPQVVQALDQRMWDDATFGTLSSDGERVYSIEGLELMPAGFPIQFMGWGRPNMDGMPKNFNQLMALDLATEGKRVWVNGGADGHEEELADAFFLGAPLPISGRLYVLAELKQGISLVVLDAKTGDLEWKQQLADLENGITLDVTRRLAGATPSFADGVLVCPTSAGALVAVDLTSRSLLWAYKHTQKLNAQQQRMQMMRNYQQNQERSNDHWIDSTVTIVEGRVLSTPIESAKIYCLNLIDGSEIWTQDRGDNLYVACVHKDKVILVGKKHVTAIQLSDGKHAWQEGMIPLPANCLPSGRGYYVGNAYFLPVSSGEVIKIDLDNGKIAARAKSREGLVPGNLICFRGEVISQGVDSVETFYQIDPLRDGVAAALKKNPDDPEALARLGELELDADNLQQAIAHFRQSFELAPKDLTRELLVRSLLEGLRRDFAANRQLVAELEKLIDQPDQRVALLRLLAAGQQKAGEIDAAFDSYMKLVDLDSAIDTPLENEGDSVSVRRDRWVRAQLASLRQAATPEQQARMTGAVEERLKALPAEPSAEQLRSFLKYFDDNQAADLVREQLARVLVSSSARLECQLLLRQLEQSKSPERQRAAVALMARLLKDAGNVHHAAMYYARLRDELANEICLDGKSGLELFETLAEEHPVRKALNEPSRYPLGIKTVDVSSTNQTENRRLFPMDLEGALGPFYSDTTLWFDHQLQSVVGVDGYGGERFRVPLKSTSGNENAYMINPNINYGAVNGHLLVISLGHQICAIDTLGTGNGGERQMLWKQDLIEQIPGVQAQRTVQPRQVNVQGGITRFRAQDGQGRALGTIGPVVAQGITFLRFRELMSVHPLTGQTQWVRHGVTQGSDLFGDDEILLVVRPNSTEATVLRQSDGSLLGTCPVAPEGKRLATVGRRVVSWVAENGKQTLTVTDPWARKDVWSRAFAPNSRIWRAEYQTIGVMEPSGKFALMSLEDGRAIVDEQLEEEPTLTGIFVLPSRDSYMLVTNRPPTQQQPNRSITPAPSGFNNPLICGRLYSFDRRTGAKRWATSGSVEQHGLLIPQPSELPMLAFVRHVVTNQNNNRGPKTSVLLVDKRNGRAIWQKEDFGFGTNTFSITGDVANQTATLALPTMNITVTFSDEPAPPEPPVQAETATTTSKTTQKGIFRIFGAIPKAVEKAATDTVRPRGGRPPEVQEPEDPPAEPAAEPADDDPFGEAEPAPKKNNRPAQPKAEGKAEVEDDDPFGEPSEPKKNRAAKPKADVKKEKKAEKPAEEEASPFE